MQEKYGFVYIWYDRKRKMYYIGSHWGYEDDGYICSSNRMRKAFKRRPEDFKRKILERTTNRDSLLDIEQKWLSLVKLKDNYYNLCFDTKNPWWKNEKSRLSISEKISKSRTGKKYSKRGPRSEEVKRKISEKLKGRPLSEENIKKRIKTVTGKKKNKYKKQKQINCPYCNKTGAQGAMKRHHFDNCKLKGL